ncbi:MAG TPA: hypothetical protein VF839_01155 [Clostridium sp.]
MCYSRQYYNQLKRKQYEEYLKKQYEYYLYKKKYYEEYLKKQNKYYLYKKKYDKEHYKRKYDKGNNEVSANKRKNDKKCTSESEIFNSFKTGNIEDNNINDDFKKNNSYESSEINIKKNKLKDKKHDSAKCHNLENKNCTSIKDFYNDEFLEEEHNTVAKEEVYKENKHKPVKKIDRNYDHNKLYNNTNKNQVNKCTIESCKTTVSSETLPLCENISHTSELTAGPVTVKIPVILKECTITLNVQSSLKLEDTVLEIKHIRKNAYLNQCRLIPNSENDKPNTGILFLAGYIRKNIEYCTKEHNDRGVLNGKLKHTTVNVPFKCTTRITFDTPPKFKTTNPQEEVEILQTNIKVCNPCEEEITGRDIREQSFRLIEFFNEKVFCELISAEFVEFDILENQTNKECKSPLEQTFNNITEKVVLFLTIKLLQNQNVKIPQ